MSSVATLKQVEKNWLLSQAATEGNLEKIRIALLDGANPTADDYLPLFRAAIKGNRECLNVLIPVSDIEKNLDQALLFAAKEGHIDCLELLLTHRTSETDIHEALLIAARKNHGGCVQLLAQYTDPKHNNSQALGDAVYFKSADAVEILLPLSDPQANGGDVLSVAAHLPTDLFAQLLNLIPHPNYNTINDALLRSVNLGSKDKVRLLLPKADVTYLDSQALRTALQYDDHEMAELLYEGSDLKVALELLRKDPKIKEFQLKRLIELEETQRQKALLNEVVDVVCTKTKARKM